MYLWYWKINNKNQAKAAAIFNLISRENLGRGLLAGSSKRLWLKFYCFARSISILVSSFTGHKQTKKEKSIVVIITAFVSERKDMISAIIPLLRVAGIRWWSFVSLQYQHKSFQEQIQLPMSVPWLAWCLSCYKRLVKICSVEGPTGKIEPYHRHEQVINISGFRRKVDFSDKNEIKIANVFIIGWQVYLQNNKRSVSFC